MDREALTKLARLNNLRPWQQEKHYVQALVLIALSEQPIVFKGGTYLWFFHGLDRFSEDLDFSAAGRLPVGLGKETSEALRMFGVENSVREISDDRAGLSFRLSAKGPLNTSARDLCHVYVEISRRETPVLKPLPVEASFDAYGLPVKILGGMALEEVATEKVRAICSRNRARDLYDLFHLAGKKRVRFNADLANGKLKYYGLKLSPGLFEKKVDEKEKVWKRELEPVVFGRLPDFRTVRAGLERWLEPPSPS